MMTGAMAARAGAGLGLLWLLIALPVLQRGAGFGFDLTCYFDAASRLAVGGSIYLPHTVAAAFVHGGAGTYVYAPPLAVALLPSTGLSFTGAAVAWYLLHVAWLALACALLPVPRTVRFAAFGVTALSGAFLSDVSLGNVNALLLLGVAAAWRWLDRPASAFAIALAASVRPQLAVVLVWWALRRRWRHVAVVVLAVLGLGAVTLPFVGIQAYIDFISLLRNIRFEGAPNNVSLDAAARLLGLSAAAGAAAFVAGAAAAVVAVMASLRRDAETGFVVGVAASLLVTPLLWPHYLVLLVVPAAFLAARGRTWALALPLLTWLPPALLPILAVVALLAPFTAPRGPARAVTPDTASGARGVRLEPDPVAGLRP